MKLPESLKIGPYTIPLKVVENLAVNGRDAFGSFSDDPPTIELNACLVNRDMQELSVLIHECLEAIDYIYAVRLNHRQIEVLSQALTCLMTENAIPRPKA